jgi:hypothetical protein
MRVFKVADGTSWTAKLHDPGPPADGKRTGWEAILFEVIPAASAQRLVYRPAGWLQDASPADLVEALEEGVAIRVRWGE